MLTDFNVVEKELKKKLLELEESKSNYELQLTSQYGINNDIRSKNKIGDKVASAVIGKEKHNEELQEKIDNLKSRIQEREKLEKFMGGITEMKKMPAAMFIVDPRKERIAVLEAKKLGIPIVAIVDTNCDPDVVDFAIPANDDASKSVALIVDYVCQAIEEGMQERKMDKQKKHVNHYEKCVKQNNNKKRMENMCLILKVVNTL